MLLSDISSLLDMLQAVIKFVEAIDANAANNPVVVKLQNVINELKAINL